MSFPCLPRPRIQQPQKREDYIEPLHVKIWVWASAHVCCQMGLFFFFLLHFSPHVVSGFLCFSAYTNTINCNHMIHGILMQKKARVQIYSIIIPAKRLYSIIYSKSYLFFLFLFLFFFNNNIW